VNEQFDWPNTLINSATLVAALSAVYFSYRALTQQKKQMVAEFRKQWIEELRDDVSQLLTYDNEINLLKINRQTKLETLNSTKHPNLREQLGKDVLSSMEASSNAMLLKIKFYERIRLKLNLDEPMQVELLSSIEDLNEKVEIEKIGVAHEEIADKTRKFLKSEWNRVISA
jgi:hypothetical protein